MPSQNRRSNKRSNGRSTQGCSNRRHTRNGVGDEEVGLRGPRRWKMHPMRGFLWLGCKEIRLEAGNRQIWSLRGMVRDRYRTVASGGSAWSSVRAAVHGQHSTYTAVTGHSCMAWSLVGHQPQALGQQLTGWQWWREGGSFLGGCACPECSRWAALPVAVPCAGHTRSQTNV